MTKKKILYYAVTVIVVIAFIISFAYPFISKTEKTAEESLILEGKLFTISKVSKIASVFFSIMVILLAQIKDSFVKKTETLRSVSRIKRIANLTYYIIYIAYTAIFIALVTQIIVLFQFDTLKFHYLINSGFLITLAFSVYVIVLMVYEKESVDYFRNKSQSTILAAILLERYNKYCEKKNYEKAYAALFRACEVKPSAMELWCRLAFFCDIVMKKSSEADEYLEKAKKEYNISKIL